MGKFRSVNHHAFLFFFRHLMVDSGMGFLLARVIPAVSAVMGTKKLPYPVRVFDIVHCARCRVPCHIEGGKLLLELNRVLRPGGYFVCSATLVYQKIPEDVEIWKAMAELTKVMCWELVNKTSKDAVNNVAVATFRKPTSNECYEQRSQQEPPLCPESDDPNASCKRWETLLSCKAYANKVKANVVALGNYLMNKILLPVVALGEYLMSNVSSRWHVV
ncbi:putative S-adenosyl-L-methionine-dependent methyltransferase protein [Corchorus olitorius]|uniref:Methyltransferase n=1 Tax=Corchorus olitorius TaxID=93759 RepID=A0A1R3HC37_9ROSI|nr:putative S-adenosyl-L-methionine-dependent methyltransferase protein [Corchorus olitorius]